MTQNEYDDLLDVLNAAERAEDKTRRVVLAADTAETRAAWDTAKRAVAELESAVKLAQETM